MRRASRRVPARSARSASRRRIARGGKSNRSNDNKLVAVGTREPTFSVDEDGLARLELEPTTQAGTAILRLRFNERRTAGDPRVARAAGARLDPGRHHRGHGGVQTDQRQHAVGGRCRPRRGLRRRRSHRVLRQGRDQGRVPADARPTTRRAITKSTKDRLLGVVEPDRFYTLYGDATEQRFEAATSRKLFVKLERRQFAALFGDFETGLTRDRAVALQPYVHGPQVRLRRRALRLQRVRRRVRAGLREG